VGWDGIVYLHQPHLREARRLPVGSRHPIKGTLVIAVAVEAANQLTAVGVAERDRHILRGHVEDVDHVPTGEVAGREIKAASPSRRAPDGLPVVGTSARCPMLAAYRHETELAFHGKRDDRLTRRLGRRSLTRQTVLRQRERARLGAELLYDQDVRAIEVDIRAA
jgi:hypothetical protein